MSLLQNCASCEYHEETQICTSRLQRMMSSPDALEGEHTVQWPDALNGVAWSQNNRLCLDGHSLTFMVFGIVDDCLWHTAHDSPLELRIRLRFLRESDQDVLIKLCTLAGANGKPMRRVNEDGD